MSDSKLFHCHIFVGSCQWQVLYLLQKKIIMLYNKKRMKRREDKIMTGQTIRKIMCCCGNGVGTSLLMQMTIEEALELLGRTEVEVSFGALAEASEEKADLFVVSEELADSMGNLPVIGLEDLMDADAAAEKLKEMMEKTEQEG